MALAAVDKATCKSFNEEIQNQFVTNLILLQKVDLLVRCISELQISLRVFKLSCKIESEFFGRTIKCFEIQIAFLVR